MEQENIVSKDKEVKGITPFTVTSYVIPLWTVVVVMSIFGDLKYKSFNHEYITHKSSHQKYNCPKKITDHTLGWAFDNVFFFIFN